jgi:hypothetical protein
LICRSAGGRTPINEHRVLGCIGVVDVNLDAVEVGDGHFEI